MEDERNRKKKAAVVAIIVIVLVVWFLSIHHNIDVEVEGQGTVCPDGTTVGHLGSATLEFVPAEGWILEEVLLDGKHVDLDDGKLVMKWIVSDHHVKAVFVQVQTTHSLTVSSNGHGSVSPSGTTSYPSGSEISVVATPDDGYVIGDVKVDGVSVGPRNVISVAMDSDHSVEVVFREASDGSSGTPADPWVIIDVDVRVVTTGADYGYVEPSDRVRVAYGGSLTITIHLNDGYSLVSVAVDGVSKEASPVFTIGDIVSDVSVDIVVSHAASVTHVVRASATSGGSISPSGTVTVADGQNLTFAISPKSGYRLSSLEVDGRSVGTGLGSYTLQNIVGDHTVRAVFSAIPSPGPTPQPTVKGDFEAHVEKVSGTRVDEKGSMIQFEKAVEASLSSGDPFELTNIVPGVHQTADMVLENRTDASISVKLVLTELSGTIGYEDLAKDIRIDVRIGDRTVSQSLFDLLSSGTWSSDILTMSPGSTEDMDLTVSLPEDAGNKSMGEQLTFRLAVKAYSG